MSREYAVIVEDANGCIADDIFNIAAPTNPTASIDAASGLCFDPAAGATVVVGATGGLSPYYYSVNGGATQSSSTFSGQPGNSSQYSKRSSAKSEILKNHCHNCF